MKTKKNAEPDPLDLAYETGYKQGFRDARRLVESEMDEEARDILIDLAADRPQIH